MSLFGWHCRIGRCVNATGRKPREPSVRGATAGLLPGGATARTDKLPIESDNSRAIESVVSLNRTTSKESARNHFARVGVT